MLTLRISLVLCAALLAGCADATDPDAPRALLGCYQVASDEIPFRLPILELRAEHADRDDPFEAGHWELRQHSPAAGVAQIYPHSWWDQTEPGSIDIWLTGGLSGLHLLLTPNDHGLIGEILPFTDAPVAEPAYFVALDRVSCP